MELKNYDSIKSLTTTQFDWKCRLILQALWRGVNTKTKEFWDINMVFIDDSNDRIHAFASTKYCKELINQVVEGKIYVVSNFRVKEYLGDETYRPVQNVRAIKSTKNDSEKLLTKFNISDGGKSVAVTLFDEVGIEFQETLKCCADAEVYVIICAAKVGTYEGLPNLTNYPTTRIYINPGHYSTQQITQRLFALKTEPVQSPPPEEINYPTLIVKQIQTLSSESNECKVNCQVKVTKVEEESSWFYANHAIHAFIPAASAHDLERQIKVGTVNVITGFTVQAYKDSDKFKIVQRDVQLIFSNDTKIQQVEDKGTNIPKDMFDFYDHSQVKDLADQTNVIGIMTDHEVHVNQITNRHGVQQEQAKFVITNGRSNLKVTLWDQYALDFVKAVWEKMETPVILILAGCRVQTWNSAVILTHVASTKYYFNYNHHSVKHLRMMLSQPEFSMAVRASNLSRKAELLTVQAIKSLGTDFIQRQVLTHVSIMQVDENQKWNIIVCTSCDMEVENKDDSYFYSACERIVPYPEIRYRLVVLASDLTGTIEIVLHDREIRHLIGKRARQVVQEHFVSRSFPHCFQLMTLKPFTIKLELHEANIVRKSNVYFATNICHGFKLEEEKAAANQTTASADFHAMSTSTQIPGLSDLNCDSSTTTKE
ncbi:hypothetical protein ACET3Z_025896 [Daucus carota]